MADFQCSRTYILFIVTGRSYVIVRLFFSGPWSDFSLMNNGSWTDLLFLLYYPGLRPGLLLFDPYRVILFFQIKVKIIY